MLADGARRSGRRPTASRAAEIASGPAIGRLEAPAGAGSRDPAASGPRVRARPRAWQPRAAARPRRWPGRRRGSQPARPGGFRLEGSRRLSSHASQADGRRTSVTRRGARAMMCARLAFEGRPFAFLPGPPRPRAPGDRPPRRPAPRNSCRPARGTARPGSARRRWRRRPPDRRAGRCGLPQRSRARPSTRRRRRRPTRRTSAPSTTSCSRSRSRSSSRSRA